METCDAGLSNYLLFIIILELSWAFEVLKQPTLNFTNLLFYQVATGVDTSRSLVDINHSPRLAGVALDGTGL